MIEEFNKENPIVIGQNPVLLDFYAEWCGPCKVTSNNLYKFIDAHPEINVYKINVDEHESLTEQYNVMSLPTIICVQTPIGKNEEILWRHIGLMTVKQLEEKIYGDSNT